MLKYLVEIRMSGAGPRELERAARALDAARTRLWRSAKPIPTLATRICARDGRLICVIDAQSLQAAQRLLRTALLPPGRVREIGTATAAEVADPEVAWAWSVCGITQ